MGQSSSHAVNKQGLRKVKNQGTGNAVPRASKGVGWGATGRSQKTHDDYELLAPFAKVQDEYVIGREHIYSSVRHQPIRKLETAKKVHIQRMPKKKYLLKAIATTITLCIISGVAILLHQSTYAITFTPSSQLFSFRPSTPQVEVQNLTENFRPPNMHILQEIIDLTSSLASTIEDCEAAEALPYALRFAGWGIGNASKEIQLSGPSSVELMRRKLNFVVNLQKRIRNFQSFNNERQAGIQIIEAILRTRYAESLKHRDGAIRRGWWFERWYFARSNELEMRTLYDDSSSLIDTTSRKIGYLLGLARGFQSDFQALSDDLERINSTCQEIIQDLSSKQKRANRWFRWLILSQSNSQTQKTIGLLTHQVESLGIFSTPHILSAKILKEATTTYEELAQKLGDLQNRLVKLEVHKAFDGTDFSRAAKNVDAVLCRLGAAIERARGRCRWVHMRVDMMGHPFLLIDDGSGRKGSRTGR